MRDYLQSLRRSAGLREPGVVGLAVLALTAVAFFRVALLPEFGRDLHMSTFELGAVTTVFAIGRLAADLPGGHFADRFPATRLMAFSALGVALGSAVLGLSTSLLPVYLAAFLLGIASSTTNATGMTYFSNVGGAAFRGTSMAVFSASLLGGQALGPAAGGLIASVSDWRFALYVAAALAALVSIGIRYGTRDVAVSGARNRSNRVATGRNSVGWQSMLLLQSVSFVVFLTLGSVPQTLIPVLGSEELGLSAAVIGLALGAGGVARFVGSLVGGRLSDRMSRKAALVPGLLGQAAGVGLLAFPPTRLSWVAAILVMSVASYAVPVAATVIGDIVDPSRVGTHLGRFRFAGDLGLIVGPVSVSAIYESVSRPAAFLVVAGLLTVVALIALRLLPETSPAQS